MTRPRRRLALLLGIAIPLLGTRCPRASWAEDAATPEIQIRKAWIAIASVEHARGSAAALDEFVSGESRLDTAARLVRALGRIGDRPDARGMLRDVRRGDTTRMDVPPVAMLEACGISRVKSLTLDVLPSLDAVEDPRSPFRADDEIRAALWALGQLADPRADSFIRAKLSDTDPKIVAAALDALWRCGEQRSLEDAAALLDHADRDVARGAAYATWRLGGARRKAKSKPDAPWAGDPALAWRVVAALANGGGGPETRLALLRALNTLTPKTLARANADGSVRPDAVLLDAVRHKDVRIAGDVAFRLGAAHDGHDVEAALGVALTHAHPLVRETAAQALAAIGTPGAGEILLATGATLRPIDDRVNDEIAVALAACAPESDPGPSIETATAPPDARHYRTEVRVLLASKTAKAEERLAKILQRDDVPPAVRAEAYDALASEKRKSKRSWADEAVAGLEHPDFVVRSNAVALLAHEKARLDAAQLDAISRALAKLYERDLERTSQDFRAAIVEKAPELLTDAAEPSTRATVRSLVERALADPSPLVRWTARKTAADVDGLKVHEKDVDPHPNDWRGLPRPKASILGLDLTKGDGWLSEEEILRLAETIRRKDAGVVLTMDFGTITTELAPYAEACPVHVANFVLCAAAGVYDKTTWHRVVPAFVIQGGDPHGDGSGDAGYSVPDEITTTRFERGILGMPKGEMKDTGGCQLFFMHCAAPHLDGGYTAYGKAIDGLDVIDKVRVGDVIRSAKVVELKEVRARIEASSDR